MPSSNVSTRARAALLQLAAVPAAFALLIAGAFALNAGLARPARAGALRCNGYAALCDRPFDEVVFAATHNSMSSAEGGYLWPFQDASIAQQLHDGIRMLLIDTHYWPDERDAEAFAAGLPAGAAAEVRAALARAGRPQPGTFLCHVSCALGHTGLAAALAEVRAFLDLHPDEVMGIFFQDGVSAQDTEAAFVESGLLGYVYTHPPATPWPTLRQMIHAHERLLVMTESGAAGPAWYQPGWSLTQDTRYDVARPGDFSCALNRGAAGNDLFLLNNWIARLAPSPADAAEVNSYGFLLARAKACMAWAQLASDATTMTP